MGAVPEGEEGAAQWVRGPRTDSEFPFGVLDPDLKGYFKTVEEQIKDWEGSSSIGEEREGQYFQQMLALSRPPRLRMAEMESEACKCGPSFQVADSE